jgi:cytochrome c biogenesis protein CcdA
MLRDSLLIFYCAAVGFVAAGLAASLYKMITHEPPRFKLLGEGWTAALTTFLFCALTGPAIILDLLVKLRRERSQLGTLAIGLGVAVIWSVCSGILVLEIVLSVRNGLA